ncbi:neuralized-like protein 4 [Uloborus diversus]|uniref:neuralized-like protein 4 n=1 Tax=Uloborus diversus TaxID=327109 RepID=UPI00240A8D26|nr:neuralized-like protein 4 [Uloborus diversus]
MALSFHRNTGTLITLSNGNMTASRNNPYQEFNNGLVMSNQPLLSDQLFEVRIDKKVPTWSGSIEIGVTNLDPAVLDFPSSATNLREGSWVMSGSSILEDGKSHLEDYGLDLDELDEGDTVGVKRTSTGDLHFFINGSDQGISARKVTGTIYAVVDLYGKCAQVSIVNHDAKRTEFVRIEDRLKFHEHCGSMVKLTNGNCTAERRKPADEFNNGVVMTHRPLLDDELFEIRIDELVNKWSGSIEMGITTHSPDTLDFPATMTNMRSGTIMMSGCGILTNGKGSRREYGEYNLDELHEGDRIGLVRKSNKNLHYYINGLDQGIASENVPETIYGVVDLYGMTVKVSITEHYKPTPNEIDLEINSSASEVRYTAATRVMYDDLLFHERCGIHVAVVNEGRTALRPNCLDDFNNAVVLTSRPLHPGELFEVILEQIVIKWAGTIEIGVTTHSPQELEFPSTMTNVRSGTWMMTGNGIMYNGTTVVDDYGCNLDKFKAGDRIGVVVYEDGKLHFFVNGIDQGLAVSHVPNGVYGVIDLYGQAAKATIVSASDSPVYYKDAIPSIPSNCIDDCQLGQVSVADQKSPCVTKIEANCSNDNVKSLSTTYDPHLLYYDDGDESVEEYTNDELPESHCYFHPIHGKNISLDIIGVFAVRNNELIEENTYHNYNHGLVFSAKSIERDEFYEIQICTTTNKWIGALRFGVTTYEPKIQDELPISAVELEDCDTWLLFDTHVLKNRKLLRRNYAFDYRFLSIGDKVGVKIFNDNSLHFFLNGVDLGLADLNMPKNLRVVADVFGETESIMLLLQPVVLVPTNPKSAEKKSDLVSPKNADESSRMTFHEKHGHNIQLSSDKLSATRINSYSQSIVMSSKPVRDEIFQVQINNLQSEWTGSIRIGVTTETPDSISFPVSVLSVQRGTWIISRDSVFCNGIQVKTKYGPNLDALRNGHLVGVKVHQDRSLHLYINGIDQGIAAEEVPHPVYAVVDIYGQCKQVSLISDRSVSDVEFEKDDKEKEDLQCDSEKGDKSIFSSQVLLQNCDHQRICSKIKTVLGLFDSYFIPDTVICFCETCHKSRGEEPYFKKGDPPKDYAQPFGWCRFPLKTPLKAEKSGIYDKWHIAFHGTSFGNVRQIVEHGKLLPASMLGLKIIHNVSGESEKSSEDTDSNHTMISPTMRYAGSSKFSTIDEFRDYKADKLYQAKAAFQVYVRPGSYTIRPPQIGPREPVDSHFSNSDLEWYTKEDGAIVLHSLLIKVDAV